MSKETLTNLFRQSRQRARINLSTPQSLQPLKPIRFSVRQIENKLEKAGTATEKFEVASRLWHTASTPDQKSMAIKTWMGNTMIQTMQDALEEAPDQAVYIKRINSIMVGITYNLGNLPLEDDVVEKLKQKILATVNVQTNPEYKIK